MTDHSPFDVETSNDTPRYRPSSWDQIPSEGDTITATRGLFEKQDVSLSVEKVEIVELESPGLGRTHGHIPSGQTLTKAFILASSDDGDFYEYRFWKSNLTE